MPSSAKSPQQKADNDRRLKALSEGKQKPSSHLDPRLSALGSRPKVALRLVQWCQTVYFILMVSNRTMGVGER